MARVSSLLHLTFFLLFISYVTHAQTISTNIPVPPLQWINLSNLLGGSSPPPPLKDASIGYDETSRSLIIFGGESANGLVQSETYLLDLDKLTWLKPLPPANLQRTPAARSAAIAGGDFAASNRHGFVVIGGKGADGKGLSDVWEYDFNNQFWSEVQMSPGGPSPRWGASGGIDTSTPPIQDPVVPGPNNTFYLAGGFDGTRSISLSDIWRLNISGTLSSNLPNDSTGSWDHLTIENLPPKVGQAGTVVSHQIIVAGGCNSATAANDSCAQQDSYLADVQSRSQISFGACPAPRFSPALVRNLNQFSSTFASQVYLLLGTFNASLWQDDNGLQNGEVAVLDIDTGSWSRIIPSGDPGMSGQPTFPSPREGAAAFSYPSALVGQSRNASSDIILFGGQDSSGNTLSEVWLLRAYAGAIASPTLTWPGFGDGRLQTGVNADGSGVRIEFLSKCASAVVSSPSSSSSAHSTSLPTQPNPSVNSSSVHPSFDTSVPHKILAPLSLALFQPVFLLFRLRLPSFDGVLLPNHHVIYGSLFVFLALLTYGLGIAGLATAFTSISTTVSASDHSSSSKLNLQTTHGKAGLAFFICLYGLTPLLMVASVYLRRPRNLPGDYGGDETERERAGSPDPVEKLGSVREPSRSAPQSIHNTSPPSSPRSRAHSWGPSHMWHRSHEGRLSSDSESVGSANPQKGFEVVNRPSRIRRASGSWLAVPLADNSSQSRSLGDIDWLQRRRSLNAVGELDYIISQAHRAQQSSTPATGDALIISTPTPIAALSPLQLDIRKFSDIIIHVLAELLLLGLCVITLVALWSHAPRAAFAVFLAWTVVFHAAIFTVAWRCRPGRFVVFGSNRLGFKREDASGLPTTPMSSPPPPPPLPDQQYPFPTQGPYTHHRPPYRAVLSPGPDDASFSRGASRSVETDDNDDDIDEHTRQRMIEEEMGRRDVSIVTIPKRKLWIANPS